MSSVTDRMDSHMDQKAIGDRISITDTAPTSRKRGCLGTLKKWWWLMLIIFIIVALVVVLPIIFVAVPEMIRKTIKNSKLTVQGISILNTESDSFQITINSTIESSSSHKATIDSFNASFYLEDKAPQTPFAYVQMPQIVSQHGAVVNVTQDMTVTDMQAWADFNTWVLRNESLRVTVDGWTHVHVDWLPKTKVHFQKTVNLTGLNNFAGLQVTSSELVIDQIDNFRGYMNIPNPSVLTLDIGNTSYIAELDGTSIGETFIENMLIYPGNNNLSIRANLNPKPIYLAVMQEPYCETGILPLSFVGKSISNNGQELKYFETAFVDNPLTIDLDVGADLATLGLKVSCSSS